MDAAEVREAVSAELKRRNLNAYRAAIESGLPQDAIRTFLDGREPRLGRTAEICHALGLELYVGPPRGAAGHPGVVTKPHPAPGKSVWPSNWLSKLALFFGELPEECPFAGPDRDCPLMAKVKEMRRLA